LGEKPNNMRLLHGWKASKLPGKRKAGSEPENEFIHFLVCLLLFPVRQAHRRAGFTGLPGSG
jgi:hypothetical protein